MRMTWLFHICLFSALAVGYLVLGSHCNGKINLLSNECLIKIWEMGVSYSILFRLEHSETSEKEFITSGKMVSMVLAGRDFSVLHRGGVEDMLRNYSLQISIFLDSYQNIDFITIYTYP